MCKDKEKMAAYFKSEGVKKDETSSLSEEGYFSAEAYPGIKRVVKH